MITLHLRDRVIDTAVTQLNFDTSVFGAFVRHVMLMHEELPIYSDMVRSKDIEKRSSPNRVFIVHTADREGWIKAVTEDKLQGHLVLTSRVGVTQRDVQVKNNHIHACEWRPDEFAEPPEPLQKWLEQIKAGDINRIDWSLLLRDPHGHHEALLALRLLCEAYQMSNGAESVPVGGLLIRAPQGLSDWLAPFRTNSKTVLKESVADLMSRGRKEAAGVFAAIEARSNKVDDAIREFLKVTEGE